MAVFSQHHVDGLDLALTPLAYMLASFANTKEQEHRYVESVTLTLIQPCYHSARIVAEVWKLNHCVVKREFGVSDLGECVSVYTPAG